MRIAVPTLVSWSPLRSAWPYREAANALSWGPSQEMRRKMQGQEGKICLPTVIPVGRVKVSDGDDPALLGVGGQGKKGRNGNQEGLRW